MASLQAVQLVFVLAHFPSAQVASQALVPVAATQSVPTRIAPSPQSVQVFKAPVAQAAQFGPQGSQINLALATYPFGQASYQPLFGNKNIVPSLAQVSDNVYDPGQAVHTPLTVSAVVLSEHKAQ